MINLNISLTQVAQAVLIVLITSFLIFICKRIYEFFNDNIEAHFIIKKIPKSNGIRELYLNLKNTSSHKQKYKVKYTMVSPENFANTITMGTPSWYKEYIDSNKDIFLFKDKLEIINLHNKVVAWGCIGESNLKVKITKKIFWMIHYTTLDEELEPEVID